MDESVPNIEVEMNIAVKLITAGSEGSSSSLKKGSERNEVRQMKAAVMGTYRMNSRKYLFEVCE